MLINSQTLHGGKNMRNHASVRVKARHRKWWFGNRLFDQGNTHSLVEWPSWLGGMKHELPITECLWLYFSCAGVAVTCRPLLYRCLVHAGEGGRAHQPHKMWWVHLEETRGSACLGVTTFPVLAHKQNFVRWSPTSRALCVLSPDLRTVNWRINAFCDVWQFWTRIFKFATYNVILINMTQTRQQQMRGWVE